jgi:signal transduction histidine kinase/ligand-binding sensor domain-containing protein
MKVKIIAAAYFFLQLLFYNIYAQNSVIKFNLVEGNNGESLGQINAITQDINGYMWFNGQGAKRIYRYDGVKFIAYKPHNLHPDIDYGFSQETIYADSVTGLIWIGFLWGGMEALNPATGVFKDYKHGSLDDGSLSAGMVSAILRDHLGRLWVGTANGLDRLDERTGKFIHYRNDPEDSTTLSSNVVRAIYEDHKGVLWVGTGFEFTIGNYKSAEDGGLNRMNPNGKFTRFMHDSGNPKSLNNNKVRAIFEDSRGVFWIGTSGDGLHTMDREKGTFERHPYNPFKPEQLSRPPLKGGGINDPITFIKEDATGAIWIGTYISGLNRYDPITKKITHYEFSNGYPDKNCWTAFSSRDGTLWLSSTDQGGFLYKVDPDINKIKAVSSSININCIYEDEQGSLWVQGYESGLLQYDENKQLVRQFKYAAKDSIDLMHIGINSIFQKDANTLWLCTGNGIIIFDKRTKRFSRLSYKQSTGSTLKNFSGEDIRSVTRDNNGLLWMATANGLLDYNPEDKTIKQYVHDARDTTTIIANGITSVIKSLSGDIWTASGDASDDSNLSIDSTKQGGINLLNKTTGKFTHYLRGINILCIFSDSQGNIWAGSDNKGLYYFDKRNNRFNSFFNTEAQVAKEPFIKITEDDLQHLWIITNSSIVKINADRKNYFIYGEKYGIRSNTLRFGGLCKTKNGDVLVGNNNGFYVLSPKEMNEQSRPLQLTITNFLINDEPVSSDNNSILKKPIEKTVAIALNYNQDNFSFNFAAIDYREPEANKYYTLLENFDSVWRDAGGDKSANYINVPPGHYIFRVKAINIDGVKAEKAIQIIINPPWWQTWFAYVIYGLLLLTGIIWTHRFQKRRTIRIERQKSQAKELAQAKEIQKAYHELKSTQAQLVQSEKMASLGELTAGIAHEIQNPLNFVNNFSEVNRELIEELKEEAKSGNNNEVIAIAENISANEDKIIHHGKRADAIVKGMLQHSRSSKGKKEPTNINALADEYLRLSYHGLRAKDKEFNAAMKTDFDQTIGNINIIPQDIGRVLLNLYNNAFYAVTEKKKSAEVGYEPTVSVSTRKMNDKIEIRVKDNGNGIPQKVVDKIFQPFFTTKPTGVGTGLGLSLSYDIVKAHGGEIKVETKEGEGSEFVIQLQD